MRRATNHGCRRYWARVGTLNKKGYGDYTSGSSRKAPVTFARQRVSQRPAGWTPWGQCSIHAIE